MSTRKRTGSKRLRMLASDAENTESINTTELSEIITICFNLSMTIGLDEQLRTDFLVAGKRLRGTLVNLLSARFDGSTGEFREAAANLTVINKRLKNVLQDIEKAAQLVEDIAGLIGQLDGLLKLAVAFL